MRKVTNEPWLCHRLHPTLFSFSLNSLPSLQALIASLSRCLLTWFCICNKFGKSGWISGPVTAECVQHDLPPGRENQRRRRKWNPWRFAERGDPIQNAKIANWCTDSHWKRDLTWFGIHPDPQHSATDWKGGSYSGRVTRRSGGKQEDPGSNLLRSFVSPFFPLKSLWLTGTV